MVSKRNDSLSHFKKFSIADLKSIANERGGRCLSAHYQGSKEKYEWQCQHGHKWTQKWDHIKAGHWCPECLAPPWNYDAIAKRNPFFAQVWYPNHDKDEQNVYPDDCYLDIAD